MTNRELFYTLFPALLFIAAVVFVAGVLVYGAYR